MTFPVSNFKDYLQADIIEKGLLYFQDGRVLKLEKKENTWTSEVKGSALYPVIIYTKSGEISGWNCECPYNHSPVCKHVAAVFYALQAQS